MRAAGNPRRFIFVAGSPLKWWNYNVGVDRGEVEAPEE